MRWTKSRRRGQQYNLNRLFHQLTITGRADEHAVRRNIVFLGRVVGAVGEKIGHGINFDFISERLGAFDHVFQGPVAAPAAADEADLEFSPGTLRADIEQRQSRNRRAGDGDVLEETATRHNKGFCHMSFDFNVQTESWVSG